MTTKAIVEDFVVDASVTAAWFLADESSPATEAALEATAVCEVWVPALWPVEMCNLLSSAQKRKHIGADKRRELAAGAAALRLRVDRESVAIPALGDLAARYRLSAYDAAYLELALRLRLPLATQDQALLSAMVAAGVAVPAVLQPTPP